MQAPSEEEEEEFHSVSLLFSFRLFVPNRPLFSLLILLFSAKGPKGRPRECMRGISNVPPKQAGLKIQGTVFGCVYVCVPVGYLLVVLPCI